MIEKEPRERAYSCFERRYRKFLELVTYYDNLDPQYACGLLWLGAEALQEVVERSDADQEGTCDAEADTADLELKDDWAPYPDYDFDDTNYLN